VENLKIFLVEKWANFPLNYVTASQEKPAEWLTYLSSNVARTVPSLSVGILVPWLSEANVYLSIWLCLCLNFSHFSFIWVQFVYYFNH
jgi:hypothetical protein